VTVRGILEIARLTWLDAGRRRISLAALLGGLAFLVVFGTAVHFIHPAPGYPRAGLHLQERIRLQFLTLAGLYAVNVLVAAIAILLPLDTLSGEIASGVMQTLASKPIPRAAIVLGKALAYWLMLAAYVVIMVGGVVLIMRWGAGFSQAHVLVAMALMFLEASVLLAIVIAGGVHVSTVANGIMAFAFYAVAFVGGWIEQIGVALGSADARYVGTVISLISPTDALWRLAEHVLEPPVMAQVMRTPLTPLSVPTTAMVWWAAAFAVGALCLAVAGFQKRTL
jgi:Cu-processing system permease protein